MAIRLAWFAVAGVALRVEQRWPNTRYECEESATGKNAIRLNLTFVPALGEDQKHVDFVSPLADQAKCGVSSALEPDLAKLPPPVKASIHNAVEGQKLLSNIYDARALQSLFTGSEAEFFEKHGFVLLSAPTTVSTMAEASSFDLVKNKSDWQTHLQEESAPLVPRLFPDQETNWMDAMNGFSCQLRAPHIAGGGGYSSDGNHQDYALNISSFVGARTRLPWFTPDDIEGAVAGWNRTLKEKKKIVAVNFWRPLLMKGPVEDNHLAVADYHHVRIEDVNALNQYQAAIHWNPNQIWYHYPRMTNDEVLAFKTFEWHTGDGFETPYFRTAFHGSMNDPSIADDSVEPRQSTDCRVTFQIA